MTERRLAPELNALARLARTGALDLLRREEYVHLREELLSASERVLNWHQAKGGGLAAWCWRCNVLRERGHKCWSRRGEG